ncbi:MAG: efflux RND transporter periplasmic adaptor subunit [Pseudomonadota bacterium]
MRLLLTISLTLFAPSLLAQAPVRVAEVELTPVSQQLTATGSVSSPRSAVLSTAVAGLVTGLQVDEGARVARGDLLLQLDSEIAELSLERLRATVRQRQTDVDDAMRRLAEAEKVGPDGGIPQTLIDSLSSEVKVAGAALAAAVAEAKEQDARVQRHRLTAPFDGVITQRITEVGEWVNPGSGLLELVATAGLRFDFRVAQRFLRDITLDTPVEISLDAIPGSQMSARVAAIVPVSDTGSRTFLVRLVADDPAQRAIAAPGMSVSAEFSLQTGRNGIAVSRDALIRYADGRKTVWVIDDGDGRPVVRERIVQTGLEFDGRVEVTSGLSVGERVVIEGNESLTGGQTVSILSSGG